MTPEAEFMQGSPRPSVLLKGENMSRLADEIVAEENVKKLEKLEKQLEDARVDADDQRSLKEYHLRLKEHYLKELADQKAETKRWLNLLKLREKDVVSLQDLISRFIHAYEHGHEGASVPIIEEMRLVARNDRKE